MKTKTIALFIAAAIFGLIAYKGIAQSPSPSAIVVPSPSAHQTLDPVKKSIPLAQLGGMLNNANVQLPAGIKHGTFVISGSMVNFTFFFQ